MKSESHLRYVVASAPSCRLAVDPRIESVLPGALGLMLGILGAFAMEYLAKPSDVSEES